MASQTEETISVSFPLNGLDTAAGYGEQRPGTTADAVNVRGIDPLEERNRGGSRHGLIKYPNQQIPEGAELIQHLNTIVVLSGEFLLVTFQNYESDFIPNTSDTDTTDTEIPPKGSGVTPVPGWPPDPRRRVEVVASPTTASDGDNVTLTITLTRQTAGTTVSGQTITLRTNPAGKDGDGDTAVTDGSGIATFTVSEETYEGQILYIGEHEYTTP